VTHPALKLTRGERFDAGAGHHMGKFNRDDLNAKRREMSKAEQELKETISRLRASLAADDEDTYAIYLRIEARTKRARDSPSLMRAKIRKFAENYPDVNIRITSIKELKRLSENPQEYFERCHDR